MLWERALAPDPAANYEFKPQPEDETWWVAPGLEVSLFHGVVASDGSRLGNWTDISPTGFAVAMVDAESGTLQMACWGPMPYQLPVQRRILRAELYAVFVMLRIVFVHAHCFCNHAYCFP